jgi:hypothetical protein
MGQANRNAIPRCERTWVKQVVRSSPKGPASPAILGVKADHGESEMKVREVLMKVYEPGRLQLAWQQVRENAGAAGIDQMVFLHDFTVAFSRA